MPNRRDSTAAWIPQAILPNLAASESLEGDVIALVPSHDPRVANFCKAHPIFERLLSRFTNAFLLALNPVVMMVREDVASELRETDACQSFRDFSAMCVVPLGRALAITTTNPRRIIYSNSFWLYPWTLSRDNKCLIGVTPAFVGIHDVDKFQGQSSPEVPERQLRDVDQFLFQVLFRRWKRRYFGKRRIWADRALFRSLNMANCAAQLPAGTGATMYDFGRSTALWVSAFEILVHPRNGSSNLRSVYDLLQQGPYLHREMQVKKYGVFSGMYSKSAGTRRKRKSEPRRNLACWYYGKLYEARCAFLHGNPIKPTLLKPSGLEHDIDWLAPLIYQLALRNFLGRSAAPEQRAHGDDDWGMFLARRYQGKVEEALLSSRK